MADLFLDREDELRLLDRLWARRGGGLILVWGRRRSGKSYLLSRFAEAKPSVYYTATERAPEVELASFADACRVALRPGPRDALRSGSFRSWDEALRYLTAAAARRRLLVVLDELSYLVEGDPSLPSVIQRWWDEEGRRSNLRLVLCGSATSVLEGLGAERAPLFGRFTARLQVHPFSYRQAALFHPTLDAVARARVYAILGGMPLYLRLWHPSRSVERNLVALVGEPASPLLHEGDLLLRTELPEAAGYFRIMAAIASGRTTFSEIKDVARMDPTRSLERLTAVRLVERRVPVTEDVARTRARAYRVVDNFLSFWFRFVYPNRGEIERGLGEQVVRNTILPRMDDHVGPAFEEMCREYVRHLAVSGGLPGITAVGAWWRRDESTEIDVVALSGREVVLAGEATWARTVDRRVLHELAQKTQRLPRRSAELRLALFAREGFRGMDEREAMLADAEALYA